MNNPEKSKRTKQNPRARLLALGSLAALAAGPIRAAAPSGGTAAIIETRLICREPGRYAGPGSEYGIDKDGHPVIRKRVVESDRYLGWGTVAGIGSGELIVAFSGDRDSHICPWGKTQIIRSPDQGRTWSEPRTITSTPLDDRDAGIIRTTAGTLLVSWFTSVAFEDPRWGQEPERYARHGEKLTAETREQWLGHWVRRSEDGGRTWQAPIRTAASAPHGPIQLRDGRLLYIGIAEIKGEKTIAVEQSSDDGRSWKVIASIPQPADLCEPHLVELKGGRLLAMFRRELPDRAQDFLMQSESADGGRTWTPVHSSGIWGYPPHLIQLRNGWVLASYGHRRPPFGEWACISRDEGRTWDLKNQIILAGAPGPDMGYPSSVQLDDGSILTVYYQAERLNQPTSLWSTHWRIK